MSTIFNFLLFSIDVKALTIVNFLLFVKLRNLFEID